MYRLCNFALVCCLSAAFSAQAGQTVSPLGLTMVDIPAGSFQMGSCKPGEGSCSNTDVSADEMPMHRVSLKTYQMGMREVTLGQYKQFLSADGRSVPADFIKYNAYGDDAPVVNVSWHDAKEFIAWLNKNDGGGYRLPTEAEWEYACRAGGRNIYCGSDKADSIGWYEDSSGRHQHAAGSGRANDWGLYDMSGNAYEWVEDCWHDSYKEAPDNGNVWSNRCSGAGRVLRGGSWYSNRWYARAASRNFLPGNYRLFNIGFRLARSR